MVKVQAQGKTFECDRGANLRQVLLQHDIDLYNNGAKVINCHGIGTCGTCAVPVVGVSPASRREQVRRSLLSHSPTRNLRLACQTQVLGDVKVTKFDGFWGEGTQIVWTPQA